MSTTASPHHAAEPSAQPARIHATADVDAGVALGAGTIVWHLAQVRAGASLGHSVVVGRGAYVGSGVRIGDNSKIQNHALVYEPAVLESGVFIGPAAVLTNDLYPRAINPGGSQKAAGDWQTVGVLVREGASVGASSVCVAPVTIGRWAMVAAGAVVTSDVPDFALVAGVPARRIRWVGRAGVPLEPIAGSDSSFQCPQTGSRYELIDADILTEVDS